MASAALASRPGMNRMGGNTRKKITIVALAATAIFMGGASTADAKGFSYERWCENKGGTYTSPDPNWANDSRASSSWQCAYPDGVSRTAYRLADKACPDYPDAQLSQTIVDGVPVKVSCVIWK